MSKRIGFPPPACACCRNIKALGELCERQKVAYDFTYCR